MNKVVMTKGIILDMNLENTALCQVVISSQNYCLLHVCVEPKSKYTDVA